MAESISLKVQNGDLSSPDKGCGVIENEFPLMGTCCIKGRAGALVSYQGICPYCNIRTLPPDSGSLEVAMIFNCKKQDYCKRVKQ
jgi:hypothetical protein